MSDVLVSDYYRQLLETKHIQMESSGAPWGGAVATDFNLIQDFIMRYEVKEILDYGSGYGALKKCLELRNMDIDVLEYEPGRPEKANNNQPRETVICVDVLEHVETDRVRNVMEDLQRCMLKNGMFIISTTPAIQRLPDGRNAHLTIERFEWWDELLKEYFRVIRHHGINTKSPCWTLKAK